MTTPSAIQSPFTQFQNLLREMFQSGELQQLLGAKTS